MTSTRRPPYRVDQPVELAAEARAIPLRERARAAALAAALADMGGDVAGGEGGADIVGGEAPPGWTQRAGAALQAACGERHVGGHANIAASDALGDPVVGGVRPLGDEDEAEAGGD